MSPWHPGRWRRCAGRSESPAPRRPRRPDPARRGLALPRSSVTEVPPRAAPGVQRIAGAAGFSGTRGFGHPALRLSAAWSRHQTICAPMLGGNRVGGMPRNRPKPGRARAVMRSPRPGSEHHRPAAMISRAAVRSGRQAGSRRPPRTNRRPEDRGQRDPVPQCALMI